MQSHGVDWREYLSSGSTESLFSLCGGREARCQNLKIAPNPMAPPVASHVFWGGQIPNPSSSEE
jgi:hypothetical protein